MIAWIEDKGPKPILFLEPQNEAEIVTLNDFARVDEPLCAVLKHAVGYRHSHLEIRRDKS